MAELVAGASLSSFFNATLASLASGDFGSHKGLVKKLEITLNSINQVMDEAEQKQYQRVHVKHWLDDVKHDVYEVDQLLDEIATHARRKSMVRRFSGFFYEPFESWIRKLLMHLAFLEEQKDLLGLKEGTYANRWPSSSLMVDSSICGRDAEKEEIIKLLFSDNEIGNQVPIISIVGLGGMGKTTLAQLAYNDHMVQEQFELSAWVCLSDSFDVVGLTIKILRSFQFLFPEDCEDLNILQCELQRKLRDKKYLIVLDDVWEGNGEYLKLLLLPFNQGSSGSKIIVTTRYEKVASIMKSTQLLDLKELEESDCWSLFVRHAFGGRNVSDYPNLEIIGKKIVDKSGGLPLAVKTLGSLLQRKFSHHEWLKILETDVLSLSEGDTDGILPALRLGYLHLPSNLKRCFAYCSIFPKGYKFGKDKLINCWMAEGLLKCRGKHKSEEGLGNEFFDDLESISFFQQSVDGQGKKVFLMHDLVNDLAKSVSAEFCLQIEGGSVNDIPKRTRHIRYLLESKDGDKIFKHICEIKGLCSLMVEQVGYFQVSKNIQRYLYQRLKYLRMLSFCGCYLSKLADEIGNLKLLRYLDLCSTDITSLPNSICKLYNLQTLLLQDCGLTELPANFHQLVNLRHLDLRRTPIKTMPKHMERLCHLQMLSDFVVGKLNGSDIKKLAELNCLHGTLHISGLDNVIDSADAAKANLKDKEHLDGLYMMYDELRCSDNSVTDRIRQWDVLEVLQPNINLSKLTIDDYHGTHFPDWLEISHLPNLISLNLKGCKFCSQFPPLGQLPFLKELSVSRCGGIEIIGEEFYGNNSSNVSFKSLEILRFEDMSEWKEWLCLEGFPCLKELSITYCPKLKGALPQHLPSLQNLVISNCRELEVSIPKADTICMLELKKCKRILINDLPSSLRKAVLFGNRYTQSSLDQILLNSSLLEELNVHDFYGPNKEWLTFNWCSSDSRRTLTIKGWSSPSFPFAPHFTNLHALCLENCSNLKSFPGGGLPSSLRILRIRNCPKLIASRKEWGLFKLNSLKEFDVSDDFENVKSFPEEGLLPPNLESLRFYKCSKLRTINNKGLLHLKSLNSLFIGKCHLLERLPRKGLLNSLSTLEIFCCSLLEHRYQRDEGEQWHTISHIRNVKFIKESDVERDDFFGDD